MNVLINGGTGFLGGRLARTLIARGHAVSILTRGGVSPSWSQEIPRVYWAVQPSAHVIEALSRVDAVVNLAGASIGDRRWSERRKLELAKSRIGSTVALVQAIASASPRPRVLLNTSAADYYGDAGDSVLTEDAPPGTSFLADLCVRWEDAARNAEQLGVRVVLPRTGIVLAAQGGALAKMTLPFRLFVGGPYGTGTQWFPWVHSADAIAAMMFSLTDPHIVGPFNLVAPQAVRMREFCRALGRALHRPSWAPLPGPLLTMVLGEMAETILHSKRIVPQVLMKSGFSFVHPTLATAFADIYA
jgi:uncharacterized protein (TIGR01777 family)